MKDKRQRITAAWPYAAVYADPAFAASILQAAANSVAMPFGYPQNPMLPHVMPHQMPTSSPYASYGYSRYAPYPIPQRSQSIQPNNNYIMNNNTTIPQGYQPLSLPKTHTPPHELIQSPSSPNSSLSLSPGSDKQLFTPLKSSITSLPNNQPLHHHQYQHHSPMGLLTTTSSPQSTSSSSSPPIHSTIQSMHRLESPTQIKEATDIPKLFKPYKSS